MNLDSSGDIAAQAEARKQARLDALRAAKATKQTTATAEPEPSEPEPLAAEPDLELQKKRQLAQSFAAELSPLLDQAEDAIGKRDYESFIGFKGQWEKRYYSQPWRNLLDTQDQDIINIWGSVVSRNTVLSAAGLRLHEELERQATSAREPKLTEQEIRSVFSDADSRIQRALDDFGQGNPKPPEDLEDEMNRLTGYFTVASDRTLPINFDAIWQDLRDQLKLRLSEYRAKYNEAKRAPEPPEPPEPPAEPQNLEERLNLAREKFAKVEKRLESVQGITGRLKGVLGGTSRETVQQEHAAAEAEYKRLRAEYMAASVDRFSDEKTKLFEKQLEQAIEQKGKVKKAYDWHKSLARHNLHGWLEKRGVKIENRFGKAALRSVNVRSITNLTLLAGGVALGGAAGLTAIALRRGLSGTSAGVGFYDLANMARIGAARKVIRDDMRWGEPRVEDVERHLAAIGAKALLDGKTIEDLKQDELYQELLVKMRQAIEREAVDSMIPVVSLDWSRISEEDKQEYEKMHDAIMAIRDQLSSKSTDEDDFFDKMGNNAELAALQEQEDDWLRAQKIKQNPEAVAKYLQDNLDKSGDVLKSKLRAEKNMRRVTAAFAAGVGYLAGSGWLAQKVRGLFGAEPVSSPGGASEASTSQAQPRPSAVEAPGSGHPQPAPHADTTGGRPAPPETGGGRPAPGAGVKAPLESRPISFKASDNLSPEGVGSKEAFQVSSKGFDTDLAATMRDDPKMLKWFEDHYGSKSGVPDANSPEKLARRFMLEVEAKHPGDYDRILKGGFEVDHTTGATEILTDPEHTVFMPKSADALAEAKFAPKVTFGEPVSTEPKLKFDFDAPAETPPAEAGDLDTSVDEATETAKPKVPEGPTTVSAAREVAAYSLLGKGKVDYALRVVLQDNYDYFLKNLKTELGLPLKALKKFQNYTVQEFLDEYAKNPNLWKSLGRFKIFVAETVDSRPRFKDSKLGEFVVKLAIDWKRDAEP